MDYYLITKEGDRFGPVSLDTLNDWMKKRRITPTSLIEGENGLRVKASEIRGIVLPKAKTKFSLFKTRPK
jgi:hypothetical protein